MAMKTIISLTDFSPNATHAAHYALKLSLGLKADLVLCNACLLPIDIPSPYTITWPIEEYDMLSKESTNMLELLKSQLATWSETLNVDNGFTPRISIRSSFGDLGNMIEALSSTNDIVMVVAGTHDKDSLNTLLQGNMVKNMMNSFDFPLLLVPQTAEFNDIKRIAFATDLTCTKDDVIALESLNKLIEPLDAELILTSVNNHPDHTGLNEQFIEQILDAIANQEKCSFLSKRIIRADKIETGLSILCANERIDILAMVHHHFNFIKRLFHGSHTLEMAKNINIPLLILNAK